MSTNGEPSTQAARDVPSFLVESRGSLDLDALRRLIKTVADESTSSHLKEVALERLLEARISALGDKTILEFVTWVSRAVSRPCPWMDANDLVQESLIVFISFCGRLEAPAALSGFLRSIVRNIALKQSEERRLLEEAQDAARIRSAMSLRPSDSVDEAGDPRRRALLRGYLNAIRKLSAAQRKCFVLTRIRRRSRHQVAVALGIRESSVPVYQMRARRSLARDLGPLARSLRYRVDPSRLPGPDVVRGRSA